MVTGSVVQSKSRWPFIFESDFSGLKWQLVLIASAVVICAAAPALSQKGPFMDDVISAADAQIGETLWAMGYDGLCAVFDQPGRLSCGARRVVNIRPLDKVKVIAFVTDPNTGAKNVRLEHNGTIGFMLADWRMWVAKDPKQTKCRDVSLQIGWSDDTVLRAMKCAPDHINSTITQTRDREQWVYGGNYLYFEDGQLVAIQRRN